MPGIAGVVPTDHDPRLAQRLESMVRPMLHRPWYRVERAVAPAAALAGVCVDDEPALASAEGVTLALAGDPVLDDAEGGLAAAPVAERLLRRFLAGGDVALRGLNGVYAVAVWEERRKRLTIVNDRHGFLHLYWWRSADALLFATEAKAISQDPGFDRTIDQRGLLDFLVAGHLFDERTFFADLALVPPASVLVWERGRLVVERYWDYRFGAADRAGAPRGSADDYADEYASRLETAVRRRARDEVCLPLTGGLDTRSLAGFLHRVAPDARVVTHTLGHEHSWDVRFARAIAEELGWPHTLVPVEPSFIADHGDAGISVLEGNGSCSTFWIMAELSFLDEVRPAVTWSGFLGCCMSGSNLPRKLPPATGKAAVDALWNYKFTGNFGAQDLATLLRPEVYANAAAEPYESIRRCFAAPDTDDVLDRWMYVDLRQRMRRLSAVHRDVLAVSSRVMEPFVDNDFMDFALSLPRRGLVNPDQVLYRRMVTRSLPHLARVGHAKTGRPVEASRVRYVARRALRKARATIAPRLPLAIGASHDYKAYVHYDEWLRTGSRLAIEKALADEDCLADMFDMDAVRALAADHMEGRRDEHAKLCELATFAMWRRRFG
jgi:asparagine synthase (glutamine-hydrolysing)